MFDNYLTGLNYIQTTTVTFTDVIDEGSSVISEIIEKHYLKYRLMYNMIKGIEPHCITSVEVNVSSKSLSFTLELSEDSSTSNTLYSYLSELIPDDERFALRVSEYHNGKINILVENIHYEREDDMPYGN